MKASDHELTIKDVLAKIMDRYKLTPKLNEVQLRTAWVKIMGKNVAQYTTDIYIDKKVLYIKLSSPALKQELSYSKEKLKDNINAEFGSEQITKVVFV